MECPEKFSEDGGAEILLTAATSSIEQGTGINFGSFGERLETVFVTKGMLGEVSRSCGEQKFAHRSYKHPRTMS